MEQLTREDLQRIDAAVERIAPIQNEVRRTLSGAHLMELGYATWHGQPIDPTARYVVDEVVNADRRLLLINTCKRNGIGVLESAERQLQGAYINARGELRFVSQDVLVIEA